MSAQPPQQLAVLLPKEARDALVQASQVEGEQARRVAVDAAIDYVKLCFPHFFHHPKPE